VEPFLTSYREDYSGEGREDEIIVTATVVLDEGEVQTASITHSIEEAGEYEIPVGEETYTVTVDDEDIPGFTSTILFLAAVIAVAIYQKKKGEA